MEALTRSKFLWFWCSRHCIAQPYICIEGLMMTWMVAFSTAVWSLLAFCIGKILKLHTSGSSKTQSDRHQVKDMGYAKVESPISEARSLIINIVKS